MGNVLDDKGNIRSLDELRRALDAMDAEAAEVRAKRVAAGLPAVAPPSFVKPEHGAALIEQLRPLYEVLTQYLAITNGAQKLIPFDTADFAPYEQRLTLVHESTDADQLVYAEMLRRSIAVIDEAQGGEVAAEYVISKLYRYLTIAGDCIERADVQAYEGDDLPEVIADYWAHYTENIQDDRRRTHEQYAGD